MKQLLFLVTSLLISCASYAHDFFFAYAEIELNEMNQRVEATIYTTTHDLERELREETGKEIKIYGHENDSLVLAILKNKINDGFQISFGTEKKELSIDGIEVKLNGTIYFYVSAPATQNAKEIGITFDLLMDTFQDQQNKLDFKFRGSTSTYVFLQQSKHYIIPLTKNDE